MPVPISAGSGTSIDSCTTVATKNAAWAGDNRQVVFSGADVGRRLFVAYLSTAAPTTADTQATITPVRAGVAGSAATTQAVTANTTMRIEAISMSVRTTTAALPWAKMVLRMNPVGASVVASPPVLTLAASGAAATTGNTGTSYLDVPHGIEFSGTQQIGISVSGNLVTNVLDITLLGFEY